MNVETRLKRLEEEQAALPVAIVELSNGEQKRLDFFAIARLHFESPQLVKSLRWISGDCSGVLFQLLACDDYWTEVNKHNDKN